MTNHPETEKPKIIVDSDWKEQVAKEKEQAAEQAAAGQGSSPTSAPVIDTGEVDSAPQSDATAPPGANEPVSPAANEPVSNESGQETLPPASFEVLVSMLFTQAVASLGQLPGPDGNPSPVDKPMAKHSIDTLEILQEKTKGNLTDDEAKMLSDALHSLRMAYVSVRA